MKKKIIVTGSSRGIGLAIAIKLLNEGHEVIITSRKRCKLKKLKKIFNKNVNFLNGDFSKPKEAKKIINRGIKILKGLDTLICNVGESKSCLPNKENFSDWNKMFNQNFYSATNAIESSKKKLTQNKGSIICISSICGNELVKGAPITYSTSKAALNFYLKSLSHYLSFLGVRINIVSPGNIYFKGSVWDKKMKKDKKKKINIIKKTVPLNKFGTVEDITSIISYLVSEKSKFITGSNFIIDGGQTTKL